MHAHRQHPQPALQVVLPQWSVPLGVPVAAEDVVDEDVEPTVLLVDPFDERGDLVGGEMIDAQRGAVSARGLHEVAGVLDGLGPVDLRAALSAAAAAGCVDVGTGAGQLDRDRPPTAARRTGDECDLRM